VNQPVEPLTGRSGKGRHRQFQGSESRLRRGVAGLSWDEGRQCPRLRSFELPRHHLAERLQGGRDREHGRRTPPAATAALLKLTTLRSMPARRR